MRKNIGIRKRTENKERPKQKGGIKLLKHFKRLMHPVRVERPNAQYAVLLQEQLGGANGELKAAMQYMAQSFYVKEQEMKDMLMEIAAEEFNHMEMIGITIQMLKGENTAHKHSNFLVQSPFGFVNMDGVPFCADYITITGDVATDLLSNIASEQRSKAIYESLYHQIEDKYVRKTIEYLMHREKSHKLSFLAALKQYAHEESGLEFGATADEKLYFQFRSMSKEKTDESNMTPPPGFYHPDEYHS